MAKNEYMTENRKKIFHYLQEHSDTTVSAKDIFHYMKEKGDSINLSTIYRNLDRLEKEGRLIRYLSEKGDIATYQYVDDDKHCEKHLHLQCLNCGKIIHLDCQFMEHIAQHASEHHDFDIQCKNSIIYGICKECKEKKEKGK